MIGLLPRFRFPRLRRRKPIAAPRIDAPPPEPAPAPVEAEWTHKPPQEPFQWAERCGWCRKPIPAASPDPEFCTTVCASRWIAEAHGPTYGPQLPPIQGCDPPPVKVPDRPVEASWIAQIIDWDRAKANRVAEERKAA